jgi:hypothetical protein
LIGILISGIKIRKGFPQSKKKRKIVNYVGLIADLRKNSSNQELKKY